MMKHLVLLKIRNMTDTNVGLLKWSINFLIKKSSVGVIKNENFSNKELAEELHKPIIKKSRKEKYQERKGTLKFYRQYLGC